MKQLSEIISALKSEFNELVDRKNRLEVFLISADFQKVTDRQKVLLAQQHTAMEQYKEVLLKRLIDLQAQIRSGASEEEKRDDD